MKKMHNKIQEVRHLPEYIAEYIEPPNKWAIISITEPGRCADLKRGWDATLRLEFHDIESFRSGYTSFSYEQANEVIAFLEKISSDGWTEQVIVHCAAGISRSAAISLFAHENYTNLTWKLVGTENKNNLVYDMLVYQKKLREVEWR